LPNRPHYLSVGNVPGINFVGERGRDLTYRDQRSCETHLLVTGAVPCQEAVNAAGNIGLGQTVVQTDKPADSQEAGPPQVPHNVTQFVVGIDQDEGKPVTSFRRFFEQKVTPADPKLYIIRIERIESQVFFYSLKLIWEVGHLVDDHELGPLIGWESFHHGDQSAARSGSDLQDRVAQFDWLIQELGQNGEQ
jgi:hypothetical protein